MFLGLYYSLLCACACLLLSCEVKGCFGWLGRKVCGFSLLEFSFCFVYWVSLSLFIYFINFLFFVFLYFCVLDFFKDFH